MFEKQMSQSGLIATDFGIAANYRNYEVHPGVHQGHGAVAGHGLFSGSFTMFP